MSGRDIGNIKEIMLHDFHAAFSNPIVVLVLVAIIILPSLYALINIQACWNPYENTGEVEFAIANLDNGTDYEGQKLNIGNELVKELKNNTDFKWTFVTEEELREGVYNGEYYAGIIIPQNLSENVLSVTTDDPHQAELEYIVNIKANPVASKLTDAAANTIYRNLNAKIVSIINLAAYGKLGELQAGLSSGASQLSSGGSQLAAGSSMISAGAGQVSSGVSQVQSGSSQLQQGASQIQSGSDRVQQGASQVQQGADKLESTVDPSLMPPGPVRDYIQGTQDLASASSQVAGGSSQLAQGSVNLSNGASRLAEGSSELAEGALSLAAGSQLLSNSASQALFAAASALSSASNSLADVTGVNESQLGNYFYSPIKLDRNELFPTPDYGSSVSPFYLVLSMWVGAIITCVMVKPGVSEGTKYSPLEMYFGKLLLFVILSILQAGVTISGAFIMGIYVDNPLLFIFSAVLVSMMFMILIYSIISALGHVGKGLAVILLVIQISGTGGIYPVEIMGWFFQALYRFLPMTYAIDLIREAQLGVVWSNYIPALIKEKADKAAHYFEERLEESGLF